MLAISPAVLIGLAVSLGLGVLTLALWILSGTLRTTLAILARLVPLAISATLYLVLLLVRGGCAIVLGLSRLVARARR